jgi:aspartokinase
MAGLSLLKIPVEREQMEALGQAFCRLGEEGAGFVLVFSQRRGEILEIGLVVTAPWAKVMEDRLGEVLAGQGVRSCVPAELVFFYGPHFGDRHGILDAAVKGLAARRVKMTAAVCSGSCIYLVLPEGNAEAAVAALSEVFEIPRASSQKQPETRG